MLQARKSGGSPSLAPTQQLYLVVFALLQAVHPFLRGGFPVDLQGEERLLPHDPHHCVVPQSLQPLAFIRAIRDDKILVYLFGRDGCSEHKMAPCAHPTSLGQEWSHTPISGQTSQSTAGAWRILGYPSLGRKECDSPPCPSFCWGVPETGSSELGYVSHCCPHAAWPGRRTRCAQGTWGQTGTSPPGRT